MNPLRSLLSALAPKPRPEEITPAELKRRLDAGEKLLLLDVRNPDEFAACRLEGARLLPLPELERRAGEIPTDLPLVAYCHHGVRSLRAVHFLRDHDFPGALSLRGGIDAWSREVDPAVPRY